MDRFNIKGKKDGYTYMKGGSVYRLIRSIAIAGLFVAAGLLVFTITGIFSMSAAIFGLISSIAVICIFGVSSLPWVKRLENKQVKKASIVFISFIGICALLWIIAIWMVVALINMGEGASEEQLTTLLWFIKLTILVSLQLLISSFIGHTIVRFGKELIPFQVVTFLSYLFVDFYLSFALICVVIKPATAIDQAFSVLPQIDILGTRFMVTMFILSLVFMAISNGVIKSVEANRIRHSTEIVAQHSFGEEGISIVTEQPAKKEEEEKEEKKDEISLEEKLHKLKDLFDKNLITEKEYEEKRAEILKQM